MHLKIKKRIKRIINSNISEDKETITVPRKKIKPPAYNPPPPKKVRKNPEKSE